MPNKLLLCPPLVCFAAAITWGTLADLPRASGGEGDKTTGMTKIYSQARDFLAAHTSVIELKGEGGAQVVVCPDLQGRIMTSTCGGGDGQSLGWINYDFIAAGKHSPAFNNYGGEDRFWLGPEGGQFGLWFQVGLNQTMQNWLTPPDLNTGGFRVQSKDATSCRLQRRMRVTNVAETTLDVDVEREVRLLPLDHFAVLVNKDAADIAKKSAAQFVGFESNNRITNASDLNWQLKTGLTSIWSLGQFAGNDQTVIVLPYKPGNVAERGPVVQSDYFGSVPPERLKETESAVLFRADGKYRAKLGLSQQRARPIAGSVDLKNGVLTLVQFDMPEDPTKHFYVNNTWQPLQKNAFAGDVFNTYNDGPATPGAAAMGGFYELESLSPTKPLAKGESLTHAHRTFHFQAKPDVLAQLVKATLGVELDALRKFLDQ